MVLIQLSIRTHNQNRGPPFERPGWIMSIASKWWRVAREAWTHWVFLTDLTIILMLKLAFKVTASKNNFHSVIVVRGIHTVYMRVYSIAIMILRPWDMTSLPLDQLIQAFDSIVSRISIYLAVSNLNQEITLCHTFLFGLAETWEGIFENFLLFINSLFSGCSLKWKVKNCSTRSV